MKPLVPSFMSIIYMKQDYINWAAPQDVSWALDDNKPPLNNMWKEIDRLIAGIDQCINMN